MNRTHSCVVRHFLLMAELSERLAAISALIIEHQYDYAVFGSWRILVTRRGRRWQDTYDGKDFVVTLEEELPGRNTSGGNWRVVASRLVPVPMEDSLCRVVESLLTAADGDTERANGDKTSIGDQ